MKKLFLCKDVRTTSDKVVTLDRCISASRVKIAALSVQGYAIRFRSPWAPQSKGPDERSRSTTLNQKFGCDCGQ
jgi:hypothetical protein